MVPGKSTRQVGPTNYISFTTTSTNFWGGQFHFNTFNGLTFKVDWGDGIMEDITVPSSFDNVAFTHSYTLTGIYTIKIYTPEKITKIYLNFGSISYFTSYNLRAAYNMLYLENTFNTFLTSLDISNLPNIKQIVTNNNNISSVSNLQNNPKLQYIDLTNNQISSTVVDNIFIQLNQNNTLIDYDFSQPYIILNGTGNNPPTATSQSARNSLTAKGWIILTN